MTFMKLPLDLQEQTRDICYKKVDTEEKFQIIWLVQLSESSSTQARQ